MPDKCLSRQAMRALWCCLLIVISSASHAAHPPPHRLLVVLSDGEPAYQQTFDSFRTTLLGNAGPGIPFEIERITLHNGSPDPDAGRPLTADLIIPVGARAARFVQRQNPETPVFNILITRESYSAIWPGSSLPGEERSSRVSALFLEQPFERQFRLIRLGLPAVRRCSILLSDRSRYLQTELLAAAAKAELELNIVDYSATRQPVEAFRNALEAGEVMLIFPDPEVITPNHAKWLLYMAYQQRTPVFGFSRAIVEAGAVAALFTTPEQAGRQAAEQVLDMAVGMLDRPDRWWRLPPPRYPEYFQIAVNDAVARALDIETGNDRSLTQALRTLEQTERWQARP